MTQLKHPAHDLLENLDGFRVDVDAERQRADIVLSNGQFNIISMRQREQLRLVFESLDEDERVRVIVLRAEGQHFSSGGDIKGFLEASPEHVSKLAWNVAAPARSSLVKELLRASSLKYLPTQLTATARFTAASASESRCHGAVLFDVILLRAALLLPGYYTS